MANQEQGAFRPEQEQGAFMPELDEPRRTTEHQVETEPEKNGYFPTSTEAGGYGGVSEQEPPHHKLHSDDEPLPKPKPGMYDDVQEEEPREEQVMPSATSDDVTAPTSTEQYQDFRSETEPKAPFNETPASEPRSYGDEKNEDFSDPSAAFPGAPVDRKVEEPGYGQDLESSEPLSTEESPESPAPKKEGLMTKIKEKLPGHHKTSSTPETVEDADTPVDTDAPPKKSLMTKIKEKLPGHHSTSPTATQ
jgi:hypothetical protein